MENTNHSQVHHMTLEEYQNSEIPEVVKEIKSILRKKYLQKAPMSYGLEGLDYLPKDEWVDLRVKNRMEYYMKKDWADLDKIEKETREDALKDWDKYSKPDQIPTDLYEKFKELKAKLEPYYLDPSKIDITKAAKSNKKEVRDALTSDTYVNEIQNGVIDFSELEAICSSHGIKIPKRVMDLKKRYDGKGKEYIRKLTIANDKFKEIIIEHLSQYIDELKEIKRRNLTRRIDNVVEENPDQYTRRIDSEIMRFVKYNRTVGKWERIDKTYHGQTFDEAIEAACEEYAQHYISTFVSRLEDKTNIINTNLGIPSIEFTNTSFHSGELETNFKLTYSDDKVLTGYCQVIIAGGYVQSLHQRYLFHFYFNGEKVSLEQMDKKL